MFGDRAEIEAVADVIDAGDFDDVINVGSNQESVPDSIVSIMLVEPREVFSRGRSREGEPQRGRSGSHGVPSTTHS